MLVIHTLKYETGCKLDVNESYILVDTDDMTVEVHDGLSIIDAYTHGVLFSNYKHGIIEAPFIVGRILNIKGVLISWMGEGTLYVWVNGVCYILGVHKRLLKRAGIKPMYDGFIICCEDFDIPVSYTDGIEGFDSKDMDEEGFARFVAARKVLK